MRESDTIYTRLADLRKDLDLTQERLAEILGVSTKMVSNYETGINALPIDKALILSEKYGYSLDWLYKKQDINFDNLNDFLIDIRELLYQKDDKIYLSISFSYWNYIKTVNAIRHSDKTPGEQRREIFKLNKEYKKNHDFTWEISIKPEEFSTYFKSNRKSSCPHITEESIETDISDEELEKFQKEIISLINSN